MRRALFVFVFFAAVIGAVAGGRLNSSDAFEQMRASMLLVTEGTLGDSPAVADDRSLWALGEDGRAYEVHDIGNTLLFIPAATGAALQGGDNLVDAPPLVARVAGSVTHALVSALGAAYVVFLLGRVTTQRRAVALGVLFLAGTFFFAYSPGAWDVAPATAAVAGLSYHLYRLLEAANRPMLHGVAAGAWLGMAGLFRFSLVPFLVAGVAVALWTARSRLTTAPLVGAGVAALAVLSPTLWYNAIRTGSPILPATSSVNFPKHTLDNDVAEGLYGLLLSPNKGLVFYTPLLLAALLLPWRWPSQPRPLRGLLTGLGLASAGYVIVIARLRAWDAFGFGPRYLVPMLPVFFYAAVPGLLWLWDRRRPLAVTLIGVSLLLNTAAVLVNWHIVATEHPRASEALAPYPAQQLGLIEGLVNGVRGEDLPIPEARIDDSSRKGAERFPDIWAFRAWERGGPGRAAGSLLYLALIVGAIATGRSLWLEAATNEPTSGLPP